jgi:GNAT superfamily N-acetyltransferase
MSLLRKYIRVLLKESNFGPYQINVAGNNVTVTLDGDQIGELRTEPRGDELQVQWAEVEESHRRKGLGSAMYDALEKESGMKLTHGDIRSSVGALKLWKKRLGETDQWMLDQYIDGLYDSQGYIQGELGLPWDSEDYTDEQAEMIAKRDLGL